MKTTQRWLRGALIALFFGAGGFAMTGCDEGGFEEAGEEIDEAADEVEDEVTN